MNSMMCMVLDECNKYILVCRATAGLQGVVSCAGKVVKCGFLHTELGEELGQRQEECRVREGMHDKQHLCVVAYPTHDEVGEPDEGKCVQHVHQCKGDDVPEERAQVVPIIGEHNAGFGVREHCRKGGGADGGDGGDAHCTARILSRGWLCQSEGVKTEPAHLAPVICGKGTGCMELFFKEMYV